MRAGNERTRLAPGWYHSGMAMTVRLPAELDAKLEHLAAARHTSKHAVLLEAAERFVSEEFKTDLVIGLTREIAEEYAELFTRLEDA